ncbi:hypothetical protein H5410_052447 [Solanum commersonii]|uniref:Reverse transcriptase n=1 Tax=Solanum commersonii TaxID=4109 RepID=A0A9J5X3F2_SOLCO|nr:hypothetical protein H5410_052447 [Solanum commersonii]
MTKIPKEWRWSTMVLLYKNKSDIQNCNNYKGIKVLSHTMKIYNRVIKMMVKRGMSIFENQLNFMSAYEKVLRDILLRYLEAKYVLVTYIRMGLHQGLVVSFRFTLVMEELT